MQSQPYYYYSKTDYYSDSVSFQIYRIDLETGATSFFTEFGAEITQLFQDNSPTYLFVQAGNYLYAMNRDNPQDVDVLLSDVGWVSGVLDAQKINRLYVLAGNAEMMDSIIVVSRSTFQQIGAIPLTSWLRSSFFFSGDQSFLYGLLPDTASGPTRLVTISTDNNAIQAERPFSEIPPVTPNKAIIDVRDDTALIGYTPDSAVANYGNVTFNPTTGVEGTPVFTPWNARALLSADCNYILLQQIHFVMDDSVARTGHDEYLGTVYVFNANTGQLTQRLSLPPGGKILVVDGYPGNFYYYNDSTNQAVAISDTVVTPTNALIDTLISLKHQAVANGWLRDDRNRGHDIDEMMRGNEWYKEGEFKKFGSWEVGKDWKFDHDWNNGTVEVLDRRLDMAKRALDRRDSVMARRNLEIFVMEIELLNNLSTKLVKREEEPIITSQGYLSLKFNAEYVIDRLPERNGRHEEGRGRNRK